VFHLTERISTNLNRLAEVLGPITVPSASLEKVSEPSSQPNALFGELERINSKVETILKSIVI